MSVDVIGNGNDDGTNFGRSGDKIGFYGLTTPIVKQTIVLTASLTTTTTAGYTATTVDLLALVAQLKATGLFA